uniref:hypothetical protein n=1 Tax=Ulva meridionalis TaxID=434723 RepID=UPI0028E0A3FC|nr:hypothetical protein NQY40_pgp024 [Ulva meridionalis]WFS80087.1 hypothetical protein [Ulva meridionalis]
MAKNTNKNQIKNNYYSIEKLYIKKDLHHNKLKNLQRLFFDKSLHKKDYYEIFIKNKNMVEKRKFLSLLLLISTNLSLNELISLKVEDFLKLIEKINDQLNNYKELENYNIENSFDEGDFYISINSNNLDLKLNPAFNEFFKEDLYNSFIYTKENEEPVLTSIIDKKQLTATNLQKDLNEEIVELI